MILYPNLTFLAFRAYLLEPPPQDYITKGKTIKNLNIKKWYRNYCSHSRIRIEYCLFQSLERAANFLLIFFTRCTKKYIFFKVFIIVDKIGENLTLQMLLLVLLQILLKLVLMEVGRCARRQFYCIQFVSTLLWFQPTLMN